MIINHNVTALNTHRQLSTNTANQSKNIEKLSSGLRINRAGDDAAGLAISEKMRGQIRGLDQASRNGQDAISLIQTAEGALNETHSILQRVRELAVQSGTDTNTADDRKKIQQEVDELAKEITRISNTTEFNTQNLLAGGLKNTYQIGANANQNLSLSVSAMDAKSLGVSGDVISTTLTAGSGVTGVTGVTSDLGAGANVTVSGVTAASYTAAAGNIAGAITTTGSAYTGSSDFTVQFKIASIGTPATGDVTSLSYSKDGGTTWATASVAAGAFDLGEGVSVQIANAPTNGVGNQGSVAVKAATAVLTLGNTAGSIGPSVTVRSNQTGVTIGDASTGRTANVDFTFSALATGTPALTQTKQASTSATIDANGNVSGQATVQKGIDVSSQGAANSAITNIDKAITTVSSERSKLGAYQNRLEHTINNLNTSSENLTAAESRIRDVDMAKEMMEQTKNSILAQASQAMLAQANQQPQGVLQLLR
ncbi:flagellin [Paenibacillus tritici]|uniref:Flagellin n=1 Tax=Paenibacillus tritici TaxID=1873425 RepID=A0ABX2DRH9_9BACL|nr:flagellin [Paenibacillus tritici]NQX47197.1 flagellin [Paenibacillus tritici]